jgi:ERCC4-type nuclease
LQSLIEGRLDVQLSNIQDMKNSFLIIEGSPNKVLKYVENKRKQLRFMYAKIIEIAMRYGVHIIMTRTEIETAIVVKWIDYYSESIHEVKEIFVRIKTVKPDIAMLMCIPLVGKEGAKNLLEKFKSVRNVLNASKKMLISVKLIGEKTANSIIEWTR